MENIKPEDILEKHWNTVTDKPFCDMTLSHLNYVILSMREYAQIACSTLSEEIRMKDERLEELEKLFNSILEWVDDEFNKNLFLESFNYIKTKQNNMSEHKTTWDLIAEIDYEISHLERKNQDLYDKISFNNDRLDLLEERRKSIISYENTDTDSINQDKTE